MPTERHPRGCECEKCEARRVKWRSYYKKNKTRILKKNRRWFADKYQKTQLTPEEIVRKRKKTILKRHGRNFYKDISKKAKAKMYELYGPEAYSIISKRVSHKKKIEETENIQNILANIDRIVNKRGGR